MHDSYFDFNLGKNRLVKNNAFISSFNRKLLNACYISLYNFLNKQNNQKLS